MRATRRKKRKRKSIAVRYPTQYMKVGEIKCLFLSCYYSGRSPLLSLGPSWPFTLFLLFFGAMICFYFLMMMSMATGGNPYHVIFCYSGIALNLLLLFGGILKNPGIPQIYIDKLLKNQMGKGEKEGDEADEESGVA